MKKLGLGLAVVAALGCGGSLPGQPPGPMPAGLSVIEHCSQTPGSICTVAGTGVAGDGKDGLPPLETRLYAPVDMAFAPDGALVVVDWNNHRIRMVDGTGKLKIVAGIGELAPDPDDETSTRLNHPTDVTFDPQGNMVIAAWHNSRVKRLNMKTLVLEDIAGTGARSYKGDGGPALQCELNLPVGVLYDPAGNLFVSDQANQRIRKIDPAGIITTVAGSGMRGFSGDGGPASQATFALPVGQRGHPAGHIVRAADGTFFLADTENNRIRRIGPDGVVSTVAGVGTYGSKGGDGSALEAELAYPVDVAIGPEGALYIADTENNCVRKLQDGKLVTVAGTCGGCGATPNEGCRCLATDSACIGDEGPATSARLKRPTGIAFDAAGNMFIADTLNHRIRVVFAAPQ
jgi:DNA-binding beta-propeller fold protein YncE